MTAEVVEYRVEAGAKRPVRGLVGGKEVIISSGGRVFLEGKEVIDGPEDLLDSLGWNDLESSDQTSEKQWDWTRKLLISVAGMILKTDRPTKAALTAGEIKIEQVVDRASALVNKIMEVQIGYEQGRLKVSHLDTAQATAEAMSQVIRRAAGSNWNWRGVPEETKQVVVGVLNDYRQAQAIVLAAEMPQEMIDRGLGNIKAIAVAKTEAERNQEMMLLDIKERGIELVDTEWKNREALVGAAINNLATAALDGLERSAKIIIGKPVDEKKGEEGSGLIGLGQGLPRAVISGTLTGIGEGAGGMIGKFKEKAQLQFPNLSFLTERPELSVTLLGTGTGILVTAMLVGGSVVLLASGGGIGAGLGLFGIWGGKQIMKRFGGGVDSE